MVLFLGTLNIRCRIIAEQGTIILTTTHILLPYFKLLKSNLVNRMMGLGLNAPW